VHKVNTTACKRLLSLGCVAHADGGVIRGRTSVNTAACKRLFSLGCVPHADGAVLQGILTSG